MRSPTSLEDSELLCRVHKQGCQGLGAIEMHSRALELERAAQAPHVSTGLLGRPPSFERSERRAMSALCHGLVVDSMFERSENVAITRRV